MSRLTYTDEELAEFINMDCSVKANDLVCEFCNRVCDEFQSNCPFKELGKKLKAYEDKQEQGLLIELPCKVGDIVYHEKPYISIYSGIQAYQITNIMISQNKKGEWTKKYRAMLLLNGKIVDSQINFSFTDIGRTVFLTRSEAEKALAKMGE